MADLGGGACQIYTTVWNLLSFGLRFLIFFVREKRKLYVKIFKNLPVKIKFYAWKIQKYAREKFWLYVKSCKKVCVKAIFCAWKKSKKGQKYVSRTLLIFTDKNNNTELNPIQVIISHLPSRGKSSLRFQKGRSSRHVLKFPKTVSRHQWNGKTVNWIL